jgi:LPXTG-motif cell wall-anchored protein
MKSKSIQAILALSLVFVFFLNLSAQAHSALESSNPAHGQVVETLPSEVSLTFNEELISIEGESINTLALKGADGTSYELLPPTIVGAELSAQVAGGNYPAGEYVLSYRAVSADGHPITGEITFSTNAPTAIEFEVAVPVTTSYIPEPIESSSNALLYLLGGLLLLVGILFGVKRKRDRGSSIG